MSDQISKLEELHDFIDDHLVDKREPFEGSKKFFEFNIAMKPQTDIEKFRQLLNDSKEEMGMDILDGKRHSYIEVGAATGDQMLGLRLMAMTVATELSVVDDSRVVDKNIGSEEYLKRGGFGEFAIVSSDSERGKKIMELQKLDAVNTKITQTGNQKKLGGEGQEPAAGV